MTSATEKENSRMAGLRRCVQIREETRQPPRLNRGSPMAEIQTGIAGE